MLWILCMSLVVEHEYSYHDTWLALRAEFLPGGDSVLIGLLWAGCVQWLDLCSLTSIWLTEGPRAKIANKGDEAACRRCGYSISEYLHVILYDCWNAQYFTPSQRLACECYQLALPVAYCPQLQGCIIPACCLVLPNRVLPWRNWA